MKMENEDHNQPVVFLMEIMERLMLGPDYARWGVLIVCTLVYTDYIIIQCAYIVCTLYITQSVCTDVCTVCINCVFNVYSVYTVCIQIVCTNMCTVCSDYTRWCIPLPRDVAEDEERRIPGARSSSWLSSYCTITIPL